MRKGEIKMAGGYVGKLLNVDLTRRKVLVEDLDEAVARQYIGGSGLAARLIYDRVNPAVDPFAPENLLVFVTGPLTGTLSPSSGRYAACAKSPLTGTWGESHSAGFWGPELKFAGFDGVLITGRSADPVYLWVQDGIAELRPASHLWGKDTYETEKALKKELDDDRVKVASIGPAGEKLVRFACIINDMGRAAGRCGIGAVAGSKRLKAVAVRGTKMNSIEAADEALLKGFLKKIYVTIRSHPTVQIYASFGTDGIMEMMHEYGDVPIRYFTVGAWPEGILRLSGEAMSRTILRRTYACFRCPIACGRIVEVKEGPYATSEGMGPEYETVASLGALCLNDNLESVAKANELCNRLGIDTISTGNAVAFAMECSERGLIHGEELEGMKLEWGSPEAILEMVSRIGERRGLGRLLGEGVRRASESIGRGAEAIAMEVKGLEAPMHDPRAFKGLGLQYATSHRGACHLRGEVFLIEQGERIPDLGIHERVHRFPTEGKAPIVATMQNWHDVLDTLILCKFTYLPPASVSALLSIVTGWRIHLPELLEVGDRTYNLKRAFSLRCGLDGGQDRLPKRWLEQPLSEGGSKGEVVKLDEMLPEYYRVRGWDEKGIPTKDRLERLGLGGEASDLDSVRETQAADASAARTHPLLKAAS